MENMIHMVLELVNEVTGTKTDHTCYHATDAEVTTAIDSVMEAIRQAILNADEVTVTIKKPDWK